jgi:hypothetical protein
MASFCVAQAADALNRHFNQIALALITVFLYSTACTDKLSPPTG